MSESDDSHRVGLVFVGFFFVCEEVLFIINSMLYGFITEQFM